MNLAHNKKAIAFIAIFVAFVSGVALATSPLRTRTVAGDASPPGTFCSGSTPDAGGHFDLSCTVVQAPTPEPTTPGPTPTPEPTTPAPTTPAPTTPPVTTPPPTTPAPTTPVPTAPAPTPTPTPTPTPPPAASFPTPGNTAAGSTGWRHTGVTLSVRTSIMRITTPGTVVDSVEARGGIQVRANNVTIKRSWVQGAGTGPGAGIWIDAGITGTIIEDVEVSSRPGYNPTDESTIVDRAITGFNTTGTVMRRVYAHDMIRGLQYGCDTIIEDSYVDNEVNPGGNHMSAIGGETCAGTFNLTVHHNHIGLTPNPEMSAALLYYPPQVGPGGTQRATIAISDNYVTGGTYCMWLSSDPDLGGVLTVANNTFGMDYFHDCGQFGAKFTDELPTQGTLVISWYGNAFTDGRIVGPPGS